MTEAEVRAAFIDSLKKIEAAQSGQMRVEIRRHWPSSEDHPSGLDVSTEVREVIFDQDWRIVAERTETQDEGGVFAAVMEVRTFAAEDAQYMRVFTQGSSFDALSEGDRGRLKRRFGEDARDRYVANEIDDPQSERWTKVTSEELGQDLSDVIGGSHADREGITGPLIDYLADPSLPLTIEIAADQITIEIVRTMSQYQKMMSMEDLHDDEDDERRVILRLTLRDGWVSHITISLPPAPDDLESGAVEVSYLRMNQPMSIERPDPGECWPPRPLLHTVICSVEPQPVDRHLTFQYQGQTWVGETFWSSRYEIPYVPLSAGDQLRLWGPGDGPGATKAPTTTR